MGTMMISGAFCKERDHQKRRGRELVFQTPFFARRPLLFTSSSSPALTRHSLSQQTPCSKQERGRFHEIVSALQYKIQFSLVILTSFPKHFWNLQYPVLKIVDAIEQTEKAPKLALRNLANYIQKLYSVPLLPNIYATPILSLSVPKTPFLFPLLPF